MAVFLINICKFNGCGITFPSLGDLIQHIEDTHIDCDPQVLEQKEKSQPTCLPLSYVLRFISDASRKESPFVGTPTPGVTEVKRKLAIKHHSYSMSSSNRSATPTGSEMDDEDMTISESEDSNDSWTTEEFSSEFIMRYGSRHSSGPNGLNSSNEKPFACPVPGCKKRYKNVNGIKYHSKNGHKKDGKVRKGFKCHCGKSYKTSQRLKNHTLIVHQNNLNDNGNSNVSNLNPPSSCSSSPSSNQPNNNNNINNINNNNNNVNNNSSSANSSQIGVNIVSSNKLPRLVATAVPQSPSSSSSPLSTSSSSSSSSSSTSSNGKYDNLGILTPATSPKLAMLQPQDGGSLPLIPISPNKTSTTSSSATASAAAATTTATSFSTPAITNQLQTEET